MNIYMTSCDYLMWDVVVDGPFVPMIKIKGTAKWTNGEVKKIQINFKAINTLHCAINPTEFNRISTCKTTKKI